MSGIQVANNLSELGTQWSATQGANAFVVWSFSQSLLGFAGANPKMKLAEIGEELGKAAKRTAPYSKTWVSRALKAGRTFTEAPADGEKETAFLDLFYGNIQRSAKAAKGRKRMTADEALKAACSFARRAVKLGASPEDVKTEIEDALADGEGAEPSTTAKAA